MPENATTDAAPQDETRITADDLAAAKLRSEFRPAAVMAGRIIAGMIDLTHIPTDERRAIGNRLAARLSEAILDTFILRKVDQVILDRTSVTVLGAVMGLDEIGEHVITPDGIPDSYRLTVHDGHLYQRCTTWDGEPVETQLR